jgi:hypothetical protein
MKKKKRDEMEEGGRMTCAFVCPCIWAMEKSEITMRGRGS